jgi:hypothetical protein
MFSHIDQNMAGMKFPEHNFVFTEQFTELLKGFPNRLDDRDLTHHIFGGGPTPCSCGSLSSRCAS